ncbi:MAG: NAD(P)-dependent alcohol dehydrogenase [Candidatus Limnocylindrales bacterium]
MQAIVQDRYGSPDVLAFRSIDRPVIGDDDVLVRVRASSVNAKDWHLIRGRPYLARLMTGFRTPKVAVPGVDVAGVVVAVGQSVTELRLGDEVFGAHSGAYAEYVAGRVRNFVAKPANLTFEQAAAIPVAAITALQALRDKGRVEAGQRALILGAGGGVGSFAVQIAKAYGAVVTAATSTDKLDCVRSIGADEVIDYTRENATRSGRQYDLVLDVGGYASLRDLGRAVVPGGTVVLVGAGNASTLAIVAGLLAVAFRSRLRGQRMVSFLASISREDLVVLGELAAAGKIVPVIDRTYPLREVAEAVRYLETGQARGKVVITV